MDIDETKYRALDRKYVTKGLRDWIAIDAETLFSGIVSFNNGIDLSKLLETLNLRLKVLLSKDHTIGHAWLMNVYNISDLQLAFKNKILPLLQEYFYNNYGKIGLVLGDKFVNQITVKDVFAKFKDSQEIAGDYEGNIQYTLNDAMKLDMEDFKSIYQ